MKIYYWSPFFTNIATIKAVINSANSFILAIGLFLATLLIFMILGKKMKEVL